MMLYGLNEASVQYISAKIIGIKPDYEKYYDLELYTPSPSYYPVECALLNELIFFIGEDILFKSTFFSTDDFKNEIINNSSKSTYKKIQYTFDYILKLEEKIIHLNNLPHNTANNSKIILKLRQNINSAFIDTQNIIVKAFFGKLFKKISNLEELDLFRKKLDKFKKYVAIAPNYIFFDDFYLELMNKLEHKSNILENGGIETSLEKKFVLSSFFGKFKKLFYKSNECK